MLPPPLSLPSSASKAALRRRALGSRAPSVAMLDDGSGTVIYFQNSGLITGKKSSWVDFYLF